MSGHMTSDGSFDSSRRYSLESLASCLYHNDPNLTTMALTAECEPHELDDILYALQANTTVRHVIIRESFFPLRRIRQHLSRQDFVRLLQQVGQLAMETLSIQPCMAGMVRPGRISPLFLDNTHLISLQCHSCLTFCSETEVARFAEALWTCPNLVDIILDDCFIVSVQRYNDTLLDPLLDMIPELANLETLHLSSVQNKSLEVESFVSVECVRAFFLRLAPSLKTVSLVWLGLQAEHFVAIEGSLKDRQEMASLEMLVLGNYHLSIEDMRATLRILLQPFQRIKSVGLDGRKHQNDALLDLLPMDDDPELLMLARRLLDNNHSIIDVEIDGLPYSTEEVLGLCTQLNDLNRKQLLEELSTTPAYLYATILERYCKTDNPSIVFYVFSQIFVNVLVGT